MQIDHKIAIIRMLRRIQDNYTYDPQEMQKWLDFEQKVSLEMDSYSLSHKLAIFKTVSLFARSIDRIQAAQNMITQVDNLLNVTKK